MRKLLTIPPKISALLKDRRVRRAAPVLLLLLGTALWLIQPGGAGSSRGAAAATRVSSLDIAPKLAGSKADSGLAGADGSGSGQSSDSDASSDADGDGRADGGKGSKRGRFNSTSEPGAVFVPSKTTAKNGGAGAGAGSAGTGKTATGTAGPTTTQGVPTPQTPVPTDPPHESELVDYGEPLGAAAADTGPEAWPGGCCATLTGLGYDDPSYQSRAALAIKVSNSPSADPQSGLYRADLVYEIKVEGFSRFIAVYQSRSTPEVGPIRSGRTSDPPILHGLGRPLVVNSGGNQTVLDRFAEAQANGWLVNLGRGGPPYYRSTDRVAPHNFYGFTETLWSMSDKGLPPNPGFLFLAPGEVNPNATPNSFVETQINRVTGRFDWDGGSATYLRSQYGRAHNDKLTGHRVSRASVVVMATEYGVSGADVRSPEAVSTWRGGEAWVFTGGTYVHGQWERGESNSPFVLADDQGRPIKLYGGPVWVSMVDQAPSFG